MKKRPTDIEMAIAEAARISVETEFSDSDRHSGYAEALAKWWNEIPDSMTDDDARIYLGLATPNAELTHPESKP